MRERASLPMPAQPRLQILGPLRLWRGDTEIDAGPPQQAQLLAVLLARAGRPTGADELIDIIWGETPPASALNTLHKYIGSLRHLLEPELPSRQEGSFLLRRSSGYVFVGGDEVLDLIAFRALSTGAQVAAAEQRYEAAVDDYVAAVTLWTGPAGVGLDRGLASASIFGALNSEFLDSAVAATALAMSLGTAERVIPALQVAASMSPLHEPVQASLVAALGAAGRQAEALEAYHAVRMRLAEQLGIDPGQVLAEAHRQVLDPSHRYPADGRSTAALKDRPVSAEPYRVADFSGRLAELEAVRSFVEAGKGSGQTAAAMLFTGPPGIGKTTTVLEALHSAASRRPRLFVDLHGFDPVPLTPLQVLRSLLVQVNKGEEPPGSLDEASDAWRVAAAFAPVVVVLDNAASEAQIRPVLAVDAQTTIVITSRRTLPGLESIRRVALGPLPSAESRDLLVSLIPESRRTDADVARLAELCGGLPLALRIAGCRIASRSQASVEDFVARLRDERNRLQQLVAGDLAVVTAFSLSYDGLDPGARRLFRSLALLHGSTFGARMVAAIDELDPETSRDQLDELADLGLVEVLRGERYRLHDLLALYAADRLRGETSTEEAHVQRGRLDRWILATTAEAAKQFPDSWASSPQRSEASAEELDRAKSWLIGESDHWFGALKSAAAAGQHHSVVDAAMALKGISSEWWQWGNWAEVHSTAAQSALLVEDHEAYVVQLLATAVALSEEEGGEDAARLALAAAEDHDQPRWAANARYFLAEGHFAAGDLDAALAEARRADAEFARLGETGSRIGTRGLIVQILGLLGTPGANAAPMWAEADAAMDMVDLLGPEPELVVQPVELHNLFTVVCHHLLKEQRFDEALAVSDRMMRLPDHPLFSSYSSFALKQRGMALLGLKRDDEARVALESALALSGRYRLERWAAEIQAGLDSIRPMDSGVHSSSTTPP